MIKDCRIISIFIALLSFFLFCRLQTPQMPTWQSRLNVPLVDTTLTVTDLMDSYEQAFFYENGMLGISLNSHLDTTFIRDYFSLPNIFEQFVLGLDDVQIPQVVAGISGFYFAQLYRGAAAHDGRTTTVPAFSFQDVEGSRYMNSDFRFAVVKSGAARLVLHNQLPVSLHEVMLRLKNPQSGKILIETDLIDVAALDSVELNVRVDDIRIDNQALWSISGKSNGSGNKAVAVNQDDLVDVYLRLDRVDFSTIEADLPSFEINRQQSIPFGQTYQIKQVGIQSGKLCFEVNNQLPLDVDVTLSAKQIYRQNSDSYIKMPIHLISGKKNRIELDISEYIIDLENDQYSALFSDLVINVNGNVTSKADRIIRLDASTFIDVGVSLKNLTIEFIEGSFNQQLVKLDSTEKKVEFDEFGDLQGIAFQDANLIVDVYSTVSVPIYFQGQVWGTAENGNQSVLHFSHHIDLKNGSGEMHTRLPAFTAENSNILSFINLQPKRLVAFGNAWIGDGSTTGRINGWDYIRADYSLEIPAHLTMQERQLRIDTVHYEIIAPDAEKDENSDITQIDAELSNRLNSAAIKTIVQNRLPLNAQVWFRLAEDSTRLFSSPDLILGPVHIEAAPIDPNGRAEKVRLEKPELNIPEDKVYLFQNQGPGRKNLFIAADILLSAHGDKAIQVYDSDYLHLSALLDLKIDVDF